MKRQHDEPWVQQRSGAEQPGPSTSLDDSMHPVTTMPSLRVYACLENSVATASSAHYRSWRYQNKAYGRRSPSHVVGHISGAVRCAFECSAKQPAIDFQRPAPFNVLVGWLESQAENHDVDVRKVKELLCQLIGAEHRLYRLRKNAHPRRRHVSRRTDSIKSRRQRSAERNGEIGCNGHAER